MTREKHQEKERERWEAGQGYADKRETQAEPRKPTHAADRKLDCGGNGISDRPGAARSADDGAPKPRWHIAQPENDDAPQDWIRRQEHRREDQAIMRAGIVIAAFAIGMGAMAVIAYYGQP